ncbi:hypothetical protein P7K49_024155 [Saguinus oedipus]|uniref:Nuclear Testis protein N-terminal domain-containing protein n=1 Tax=Saguinus oedipus TaxID=9490 RepID=A0ABQ9UNQ5_SAGOE|nr:hypothetical protein P7K49_024155 [Saguinus oedipus]
MSGSYVLNLFTFKFSLIYLNSGESVEAGHSLGPVLDFSHRGNCQTAVISTQPDGMASNGACSDSLWVGEAGDYCNCRSLSTPSPEVASPSVQALDRLLRMLRASKLARDSSLTHNLGDAVRLAVSARDTQGRSSEAAKAWLLLLGRQGSGILEPGPSSLVKQPSRGVTEHPMHTQGHLQAKVSLSHALSRWDTHLIPTYPVLVPGVPENPGATMPVFTALSFTIPAPGPAHGPPLVTAVVPPGGPPVLCAFPRTPLVAGQDGRGPNWAGASNVLVQMGTEVGPVKPPQAQTLVLTQASLVWQAPGTLCEGVACPPPRPLAAAPVVPAMAAQVFEGTQACEGGWPQGFPPPAPSAPQPAPMMAPGNACPWPQGAHGEGSQAPSQAKAQLDDSCNPKSVYENFRLWQHYKPLARRHLPQSPDTEALSCFFM